MGVFTSNGYQVTWGIILISSLVHCDNDLLTRNSGHRFIRCIAYVLCCVVGRWLSFRSFFIAFVCCPHWYCWFDCHLTGIAVVIICTVRSLTGYVVRLLFPHSFVCTSDRGICVCTRGHRPRACSLRCSTRDVVHSFSSLLSAPGRSTGGLWLSMAIAAAVVVAWSFSPFRSLFQRFPGALPFVSDCFVQRYIGHSALTLAFENMHSLPLSSWSCPFLSVHCLFCALFYWSLLLVCGRSFTASPLTDHPPTTHEVNEAPDKDKKKRRKTKRH